VVLMKECGADGNAANKIDVTALMRAALNGHTAAVVALAQEYGAVNAAYKNCSTALMGAAQNGHMATVVAW